MAFEIYNSLDFGLIPRIKGNRPQPIQADPLLGSPEPKPPKRLQFPIKFKVFLRLLIGGRSYSGRLVIFRKYWRYVSKMGMTQKTEAQVEKSLEEIIQQFASHGVDENSFDLHTKVFPNWRKMVLRNQRRSAAKSRWSQEKSKKPLGGSSGKPN